VIEAIRGGTKTIELPPFDNPEVLPKVEQLSFLPSFEEADSLETDEDVLEESGGDNVEDNEDEI
jgi:hypothetical protein